MARRVVGFVYVDEGAGVWSLKLVAIFYTLRMEYLQTDQAHASKLMYSFHPSIQSKASNLIADKWVEDRPIPVKQGSECFVQGVLS